MLTISPLLILKETSFNTFLFLEYSKLTFFNSSKGSTDSLTSSLTTPSAHDLRAPLKECKLIPSISSKFISSSSLQPAYFNAVI